MVVNEEHQGHKHKDKKHDYSVSDWSLAQIIVHHLL